MDKEIKGIVQQNPVILEQCCVFIVQQEEESYLIVSTDKQAGKDHIFVERGQEISIRGKGLEDKNLKGVVVTRKAEIKIKKRMDGSVCVIQKR